MPDNPIIKIDLGDLSKPMTVLIEKISGAVGDLYQPHHIVRLAKAGAEAERVQAESRIELTDLDRRALRRWVKEEARKQSNMEAVAQKALPLLEDKSSPQDMADDWITNFFEKSRIVSDEDMQKLWSRVLAGEANHPGTFSRLTVNLLADLDKGDAELFTRLCGFAWLLGSLVPLVFDVMSEVYNCHGINFATLSHLESLGLIQFDNLAGFRNIGLSGNLTAFYYGTPVQLILPNDANNEFKLGRVLFTRAGHELAPVSGSTPVEGFFDFVYDRWAGQSLVSKKDPGTEARAVG